MTSRLCELDSEQGFPVISILAEIGSLSDTELFESWNEMLRGISALNAKTVIVDFNSISYFGSSFLEALRRLWQLIEAQQGTLYLCEVSPVGREILAVAHLDRIWTIVPTRADAVRLASTC